LQELKKTYICSGIGIRVAGIRGLYWVAIAIDELSSRVHKDGLQVGGGVLENAQ
jgi:hypothetical protein